jgi:hypothetical protein
MYRKFSWDERVMSTAFWSLSWQETGYRPTGVGR